MTGKNREVRRIFEKLDCRVLSLKRISYGDISLGDLKYKSYRYIDLQKISKYIWAYFFINNTVAPRPPLFLLAEFAANIYGEASIIFSTKFFIGAILL